MLNTQVAANSHLQAQKTGYGGVTIQVGTSLPEGFECPRRLVDVILKPQARNDAGFQFEEAVFAAGDKLSCIQIEPAWEPMNPQEIRRLLELPPEPRTFLCLISFGGRQLLATFENKGTKKFGLSLQLLEDALSENYCFEEETTIFFSRKKMRRLGH